jgi:hypothetical protein
LATSSKINPLYQQIHIRRIGSSPNFVEIDIGNTDLCRVNRRTEQGKEFIDVVFAWDDWKMETT